MKPIVICCGLLACLLFLECSTTLYGQAAPTVVADRETEIVESASQVLKEIMEIPAKEIPTALLADAQGIAIIPRLLKGGFVIGVRRGHGVVMVRDEQNGWKPPSFVTVTGGSIGWQIGIQATDLILVFKTKKSVQKLLQGKFTIGADVAAAAGPVGREAAAATDAALSAEIYSYSRSRGLFAGISLDGSAVQIDSAAAAHYYRVAGPGQIPEIPLSAQKLLTAIAQYTAVGVAPTPAVPNASQNAPANDPQSVRRELAASSVRLAARLDDNWKRYLALPAEVFDGGPPPSAEALRQSLARFGTVAADPKYRSLAQTPEFQNAYAWLKKYASLETASRTLSLPPPPR